MSNLAISAGRKLFERHLNQYTPTDPLYETYIDNKGRERRRKRETPPGLSKRDAKILKSVQRRAHYLDKGFRICGLRFGWTFIIGLIPGAGDVADATLNYTLVVRKARKAEIPDWLVRKMLLNNAVSAAVGFVPVVGDVVLAVYKANSRNAALLEEYLRIRGEEFLKAESERVQDPSNVRPGAGRQPDEHVPGKDVDQVANGSSVRPAPTQSSGGWFRKKSKGKSTVAANGAPHDCEPFGASDSRFVEHVPGDMPVKR